MLFEDFQNLDGNLGELLSEIADWIKEHEPVQPVIVPIEQDSKTYLHFRLYMNDYK